MKVLQNAPIVEMTAAPKTARNPELVKASRQMESVFLGMLIRAMEQTVPDGGLTGSKNNLAKMMFSSVMATEIAEQGGIGLADSFYQSLAGKSPEEMSELDLPKLELPLQMDLIPNLLKIEGNNDADNE